MVTTLITLFYYNILSYSFCHVPLLELKLAQVWPLVYSGHLVGWRLLFPKRNHEGFPELSQLTYQRWVLYLCFPNMTFDSWLLKGGVQPHPLPVFHTLLHMPYQSQYSTFYQSLRAIHKLITTHNITGCNPLTVCESVTISSVGIWIRDQHCILVFKHDGRVHGYTSPTSALQPIGSPRNRYYGVATTLAVFSITGDFSKMNILHFFPTMTVDRWVQRRCSISSISLFYILLRISINLKIRLSIRVSGRFINL